VVVAGGTSGIGRGLVARLANAAEETRPRLVVATARCPTAAASQHLLRDCPEGTVRVLGLDVTDETSVSRWADELASTAGPHVDLLLYNAGVYGPRAGLEDLTATDFDLTFRTNATGAFLVVQALTKRGLLGGTTSGRPFPTDLLLGGTSNAAAAPPGALPALRADGEGGATSIVALMSSVLASQSDEVVSQVSPGASHAYRASKAALNALGLSFCVGLAPQGVATTTLHPGYVRGTGMTGDQGWLTVDESVDGLVALLTGAGRGGGAGGSSSTSSSRPLHGRWWHAGTLEEIPW
jgi:NAD(P)-dependent dehydrogenase (short-subunit alcohol dehydrogenase family)